MITRLLRATALAAALLPPMAQAASLSLDSALDLAVQRSESARAARAGMSSASESSRAAGQQPDPRLRVGIDNLPATGADRLHTTRDPMTMKRIGLSQEWLSSDKRAARQAAAEAMVGRERSAVDIAAAEARLQTALAYVDACYTGEVLTLATLLQQHANEELATARARLASSTGNSQEMLALLGGAGLAEDDVADVRQQQRVARVALQRWVGASAEEVAPIALPAVPSEQSFVARHPAVVVAERDIDVARRAASVASSDRDPNWTWEVGYGQRTGRADMVSVGVTIPLPIARDQRQDRETASRFALVDKAQATLAEATRAASGEYLALASAVELLQARVERYRGSVLAPAEQRTAAALAAYRSNQASLVTVFESRHAEVGLARKLLLMQRDLARAQAQLIYTPVSAVATP